MYEYKVIQIGTPKDDDKTKRLNELARDGWQLKHANQDFTQFIFEREFSAAKKAIEQSSETVAVVTLPFTGIPAGATRTSDAIRETDTQEVVGVSNGNQESGH